MDDRKKYFEAAYRTGMDEWTQVPFKNKGEALIEKLPKSAMLLDIGCGRGLWALYFAKAGLRVIGIDYISEIIAKDNEEAKNHGLSKNVRFMEGDALDIPFTDEGFDAVTDIGFLHHLPKEQSTLYIREVLRVLKPGGYFFNVSLSKETIEFFSWKPKRSKESTFMKEGVEYHFFTQEEMIELFDTDFEIIEQTIEHISPPKGPGYTPHKSLAYVISLMRKR